MTNITYDDVRRYCTIQGHHGGRAVVFTAQDDSPIPSGYCVVDVEAETFLQHFDDNNSAWAYGYAEGYDDAY